MLEIQGILILSIIIILFYYFYEKTKYNKKLIKSYIFLEEEKYKFLSRIEGRTLDVIWEASKFAITDDVQLHEKWKLHKIFSDTEKYNNDLLIDCFIIYHSLTRKPRNL